MALQAIAFYLMAAATLGVGIAVVSARNPVHSVLFLIAAFFSAAGLFVLLGAEFLAMLLVVVYVGAVAVLFLFVVMMLDVDFAAAAPGLRALHADRRADRRRSWPSRWWWSPTPSPPGARPAERDADGRRAPRDVTNAEAIGRVLYTDYVYFFQAAGMVLLVAMIGAIVLTLRHKPGVRRQVIMDQVLRTPATGMRMVPQARRRDRRMTIGLAHYLAVAAILFTIGVFGIFVNRKNIIVILMSIELILLAVNINLVAFSVYLHNVVGQIFAMFVLTVAAAEAAVGLAILVTFFRNRGDIAVDDVSMMKG